MVISLISDAEYFLQKKGRKEGRKEKIITMEKNRGYLEISINY